MTARASRTVYYNSLADEAVYAIIRAEMPAGFELVTLQRDDDEERCRRIAAAQVAIVAGHPLRRHVIDAAPRLTFVHHQGVGYQDTLDLDALRERGIRLALTTAGTTQSVAEHALLLTLAVLRRLPYADAQLRLGHWHVNTLRPQSRDLCGRRIGYIGMGRIGQAVAELMRAFGAPGLYHDPGVALDAARERELGLRAAPLDEVIAHADVLTLHVPATPATHHLINARRLGLMQPGAVLVNTARGPLVDESALYQALTKNRIGGAALDVFEVEPPRPDNPLFSLHNVVVTPHISAGTRDSLATKMRALFGNLTRFFAGEALENEVDLGVHGR